MADWYRLGQLGSRMMPEYYAAQSRELEAQKQRMGVEALGEEMARARDAYGRQDVIQQRQDITWEQQQADRQAKLQQAEQEKARKAQVEGAMAAFWKRDAESMKKVLELDDFQFGDGAVKLRGKNGQEYKVPNAEFVAGMTGDANAYTRALELDIKREREERARLQAEASIAASKQRIRESESRVQKNRAALGGGGSKDKVGTPNQRFMMKALRDRGMSEPEARSSVASIGIEQRRLEGRLQKLEAERAKIEADPDLFGSAKSDALARIASEYKQADAEYDKLLEPFKRPIAPNGSGGSAGGSKLPPPPPGAVIVKR